MELDVEADVSLSVALGKLTTSINTMNAREHRKEQIRLSQYPRQLPLTRQFTSTSAPIADLDGPVNGRFWQVRLLSAMAQVGGLWTALPTNVPVSNSGSFAGAAAGATTLPAGASISGFTLTFAAGTATDYAVTVTNVAGGTLTYNVQVPATGLIYTQSYNPALLAASPGSQITVNVPAVAGGPAYSIDVTGQQPTTSPVVTIYAGQNIVVPGLAAGMLPSAWARWQFTVLPGLENFSGDQVRLQYGEHLLIGVTGLVAGPTIVVNLVINDIPMDRGDIVALGA